MKGRRQENKNKSYRVTSYLWMRQEQSAFYSSLVSFQHLFFPSLHLGEIVILKMINALEWWIEWWKRKKKEGNNGEICGAALEKWWHFISPLQTDKGNPLPSLRGRPIVHGFHSQRVAPPHGEVDTRRHTDDPGAVKTVAVYNIWIWILCAVWKTLLLFSFGEISLFSPLPSFGFSTSNVTLRVFVQIETNNRTCH